MLTQLAVQKISPNDKGFKWICKCCERSKASGTFGYGEVFKNTSLTKTLHHLNEIHFYKDVIIPLEYICEVLAPER